MHIHVFKWEMRRKKERSKQGQTNKQGKATQHTQGSHMYMYVHVDLPLVSLMHLCHTDYLFLSRRQHWRMFDYWRNKHISIILQFHMHVWVCQNLITLSNCLELGCTLYNVYTCFNERWEKEERKKQAKANKQTRQSNTAHPRLTSPRKNAPQVGFEPTPLYSPDRALHVHVHVLKHVFKWEMRRKEERSKQGQTNNKVKQHSTPKAVTFPKQNELPQVGLEPTTLHDTLHSRQNALPLSYTCTCTYRLVMMTLPLCSSGGLNIPEPRDCSTGLENVTARFLFCFLFSLPPVLVTSPSLPLPAVGRPVLYRVEGGREEERWREGCCVFWGAVDVFGCFSLLLGGFVGLPCGLLRTAPSLCVPSACSEDCILLSLALVFSCSRRLLDCSTKSVFFLRNACCKLKAEEDGSAGGGDGGGGGEEVCGCSMRESVARREDGERGETSRELISKGFKVWRGCRGGADKASVDVVDEVEGLGNSLSSSGRWSVVCVGVVSRLSAVPIDTSGHGVLSWLAYCPLSVSSVAIERLGRRRLAGVLLLWPNSEGLGRGMVSWLLCPDGGASVTFTKANFSGWPILLVWAPLLPVSLTENGVYSTADGVNLPHWEIAIGGEGEGSGKKEAGVRLKPEIMDGVRTLLLSWEAENGWEGECKVGATREGGLFWAVNCGSETEVAGKEAVVWASTGVFGFSGPSTDSVVLVSPSDQVEYWLECCRVSVEGGSTSGGEAEGEYRLAGCCGSETPELIPAPLPSDRSLTSDKISNPSCPSPLTSSSLPTSEWLSLLLLTDNGELGRPVSAALTSTPAGGCGREAWYECREYGSMGYCRCSGILVASILELSTVEL